MASSVTQGLEYSSWALSDRKLLVIGHHDRTSGDTIRGKARREKAYVSCSNLEAPLYGLATYKLVVVGKLRWPGRRKENIAGRFAMSSDQTGFLIRRDFFCALEKEVKKYICDEYLGRG